MTCSRCNGKGWVTVGFNHRTGKPRKVRCDGEVKNVSVFPSSMAKGKQVVAFPAMPSKGVEKPYQTYQNIMSAKKTRTLSETFVSPELEPWEKSLKGYLREYSGWFNEGRANGATVMAVMRDTKGYSQYPLYVYPDDDQVKFLAEREKFGENVVTTFDLRREKKSQILAARESLGLPKP